jgi:hypothetical protein
MGHILGTTTLVVVFLGLALAFTTVVPQPYRNAALQAELDSAADEVASTLTDLVIVSNSTQLTNLTLVKQLDVPVTVSNSLYTLTLTTVDGVLGVVASPDGQPGFRAFSPLAWRSDATAIRLYDAGAIPGLDTLRISPQLTLNSGLVRPGAWIYKAANGTLWVGLGTNAS